jgi:hypothetical protein
MSAATSACSRPRALSFVEVLVRALAVSGTAVGVTEYTNVVDRPAGQLNGCAELRDRAVELTALCAGITQRVMRKRKGRLERHHLFELRNGASEIVTEMVDVPICVFT